MRWFSNDRTLVLALLVLNTLLKFNWLGVNELSGDEPFTVFWATRPMSEFAAMLRTENNPPLYFLLIKAWTWCVPLEEAWLRIPSAVFSALTVWPLFLLARNLGGGHAAWVAPMLFSLNDHQYVYAHEVRGYSLLLLLTVLSMWLVSRGSALASKRSTLLMGVVFAAMVWTHFFGWLVIGLLVVCTTLLPEFRAARRAVLLAGGLAMLAFLPYGIIFMQRAGESMTQGTWVKPHGAEEIWHMVRRWANQPVVTLLLLVPLLVVSVRERVRSVALRFALLWWSVPLVGLWLAQWWVPAFVDRYLLFASAGFYLALGYGLMNVLQTGPFRWVAPVIGIGAMAFTFTPWKDNGQHPSAVAAQVRVWQPAGHELPVLVRPFYYKPVLWAHLDRTAAAPPPWRESWSERYNDMSVGDGFTDARELILVQHGPPDGARLAVEGFRLQEEVRVDGLVRVARFVR